jgi:hypothetical protein
VKQNTGFPIRRVGTAHHLLYQTRWSVAGPLSQGVRWREMYPHEEATIRAFITPPRRTRWLESLASAKRRAPFLDCLNHCQDIDERYATPLPSNADVVEALQARGAPATCHLLSATTALDGREMPLAEAVAESEMGGWGTIICCLPGRLAYYYDECGERRFLLERGPA